MKKNITALLLALILLLGCLSGCGRSRTGEAEPDPEVTEEVTGETDETTLENEPVSETPDKYDIAAGTYPVDTVVMTINGENVTWGDYYYWLYAFSGQMEYYYAPTSWNDELYEGMSFGGYVQMCVEDMLRQYWVVGQKVKELGIELNETDLSTIQNLYDSDVANYGGGTEEGFEAYLEDMHITPELYERMNEVSRYYNRGFEEYFGANGEKVSDEDALAWANDQGYMRSKHILLANTDDEGNALTEEEMADKKAQAEELLAQLNTSADREELLSFFDELMLLHSEDPGVAYYTDGYYFTSGEMVSEFEEATAALADYEVSGVVESDYGYHIILRLPLEAEGEIEYGGATVRYMAAAALYDNITGEWFEDAEVVYEPDFEKLDMDALFVG